MGYATSCVSTIGVGLFAILDWNQMMMKVIVQANQILP